MKKTLIAAALLSAFCAAQAQVVVTGETTNSAIVQVGASNVNAGPHTSGKPGFGTDGTTKVDPGGIGLFTMQGVTNSSGALFTRHQLLGYTHQETENGGTISTNLYWAKVPSVSNEIYFGIANDVTKANPNAAFYVGDRSGYALPTSSTNYAAVALVATDNAAPVVLTGNLRYDTSGTGTLNSANATTGANQALTGTGGSLQITTAVTASTGTFSGTSSFSNTSVAGSGSASGQFYGSGATSAVAGVASGTGYVAAFGGIKN